jgi:hypothetical protein
LIRAGPADPVGLVSWKYEMAITKVDTKHLTDSSAAGCPKPAVLPPIE